jgi:hypothetical protein
MSPVDYAALECADRLAALRAELTQLTTERDAMREAAREVLNCVGDKDLVWDHQSGGCLTRLQEVVDLLDSHQEPAHA